MTILRIQFENLLFAAVCWACLPGAACCFGQANPFGDPDRPVARQADLAVNVDAQGRPDVDPGLPEGTRLVIRAVRDSNPTTAVELSNAVKTLLDVSQYDQARFYMKQLETVATDDAALFTVYETLGSDFFLTLHATEPMLPEGRALARKVLAVAKQEAYKPERINELVSRLNDGDISVRSQAYRKLKRLGAPAVAEMMLVFADDDRQQEFPGVRATLKLMGNDAIPVLLGAARAPNLQVQAESVRALGHFRSGAATDVMMRTYLSPKLPQSLRRIALDSLMRSDRLPADPGYVEDRFYQRSQDYLMGTRKVPGAYMGFVTIWRWDANTNRLIPVKVSTPTAARLMAAERAADLYEIRPNSKRNRQMYLITQLEAAKRITGSNSPVDVYPTLKRFPDVTIEEIESILVDALDADLIPAATACCEILGEIGTPELLYAASDEPRALVQAMMTGDRHLQFAAFEAIKKLDPQQAFAGSSYMTMFAVYLASSEGRAAGLVGHIREDVAQSYAATLLSAGLFGKSTSSSRDFFRVATSDPDLDALLITDTLDRPDYSELIQQLRNDFRTKRTPIALLYRDSTSSLRLQRLIGNDPYFIPLPLSLEPEFVAAHIRRLRMLAKPWPVNDLDRQRHSSTAIGWLNNIASDREAYAFYNLGSYEDQLTRMLYLPGFADQAAEILVNLGTPMAQRELVNYASQSGLPLEARRKVVEAFSRAVANGGTLLTRKEIMNQYDRYNASETEPEATQKVLGSILDAIEARVREAN